MTEVGLIPRNGFATAGFVLGLLGLLFSPIPVIGIIAWPLVILGIIFSGVGLFRALRDLAPKKGLAIAGLACSAIGLIICIIWVIAFGATLGETTTTSRTPAVPPLGPPSREQLSPAQVAHTVVFEVEARGDSANVKYGEGYIGDRSIVVRSGEKWSQPLTLDHSRYGHVAVSVTSVSWTSSSSLVCRVKSDGQVIAEQSGTSYVSCSAELEF
jgi:hypothetical protein